MANTATRTLFAATLAAFAGLVLAPTQSRAEFPEKPVNLIVPLGAGGSHDLNARVIASNIPQYLGTLMGVSVITGEAGQTGTKALAAAPADGYTLLFTHNYIDMLQQYVTDLPYDPAEAFVPVVRVNYAPASIIVRSDSPFETFDDLMAAAEAAPDSVSLGHSGDWGAHFVPAAQIMQQSGVDFDMVAFQGGGPAMQALLAGDLDVAMSFPSATPAPWPKAKSAFWPRLAASGCMRACQASRNWASRAMSVSCIVWCWPAQTRPPRRWPGLRPRFWRFARTGHFSS